MHGPQGRFVRAVVILQRNEHGKHDEQRVLGAPRRRPLTKQQIFERWRAERFEPRVDAGDIGVEELAIRGAHQRHCPLRFGAKPMDTDFAVDRHGSSADQRRQLTGRTPAR